MFDAASRLTEGRPAVDAVQDYVWACHLLGFQDPDLTLHPSQVRDWYGSEDGIDLGALDADCEALRAVAAATEAALARQDAQVALMTAAWQGPGAQASRDFLQRHGEASAAVVAAVRTAAESLVSLRDGLWHSVDGKVAATLATAGQGARPDWRAAAQTVTTGAGDRATASELVDQEVKPFVDTDIRGDWLTAMRSAMAAVVNAYDAAAAEMASELAIPFDVPGDLGPAWSPAPSADVPTAPASVASAVGPVAPVGATGVPQVTAGAPSGFSAAPAGGAPSASAPVPAAMVPPPSAPTVDPAGMAPPSLPSMGGGMPDIGSGLSGFGGQLGDMLGGLLGTSQDALSDLPGVEEPDELDEPDEGDPLEDEDEDEPEEEPGEDETEAEGLDPDTAESDSASDASGEAPGDPIADPVAAEPNPPPTPAPPPIEPLAAQAPATVAGTPCEIAADELPQVGE
jgi:hypothetical protein